MATRKRVQSDPNLPLVPLRPSIQAQGGTFPTVGIDVPKSNSAQRIATALNRLPGLTGQLSNINQQRGVEAAQSLSPEEINDIIEGKVPAPTGGALGRLGFQKAFNELSAKRYADTEVIKKYTEAEDRINLKLDELAKSGTPIETALGYVDEELATLQEGILKNFENNPDGQRVINTIVGELSSRVKAGSTSGYEKKQKDYLDGMLIEQLENKALDVLQGKVTPVEYLKNIDKSLKDRGFEPSKRNEVSGKIIKDITETLVARGNLVSAEYYLNQWEGAKVDGKPINQTLAMTKTMAQLYAKIESAKGSDNDESGLTYSQQKEVYVGSVVNFLKSANQFLYSPKEEDEESITIMSNQLDIVLERLQTKYPEEILLNWRDNLLQNLADKKANGEPLIGVIRKGINNLAYGRDLNGKALDNIELSDKAKNIADASVDDVDAALIESSKLTEIQEKGGYTAFDKQELQELARTKFLENSDLTPKQFMVQFADPTQPIWNGLQRVWNDVHKIDWIYNEDSPYFNRNSILKAALENSVNVDDFKGLASGKAIIDVPSAVKEKIEEVEEILTKELKEEARVISEQDLTLEQKQEQLKTIRDAIIEDEKLEFQLELKALQKQKASTNKNTFDSVYKNLFNDGKGKSADWKVLTNLKNTTELEALWNPDLIGKALDFQEAARTQTGSSSGIEMPWNEVSKTLSEARVNTVSKSSAIRNVLLLYGYPEFDENNVVEDLKQARLSFDKVRLVSNHEQLDEIADRFTKAARYFDPDNQYVGQEILRKKKGMSKKESDERKQTLKDLELMSSLGISGIEGVSTFIQLQELLLPPR